MIKDWSLSSYPADPRLFPCPTCGARMTGFHLRLNEPARYFHLDYSCYAPEVFLLRRFVGHVEEFARQWPPGGHDENERVKTIIGKALEVTLKKA